MSNVEKTLGDMLNELCELTATVNRKLKEREDSDEELRTELDKFSVELGCGGSEPQEQFGKTFQGH